MELLGNKTREQLIEIKDNYIKKSIKKSQYELRENYIPTTKYRNKLQCNCRGCDSGALQNVAVLYRNIRNNHG